MTIRPGVIAGCLVLVLGLAACGSDKEASPEASALLALAPGTMPGGAVGLFYLHQIAAAGGSGQGYDWSVTSGSMPPGLALSNGVAAAVFSGVPTTFGQYQFDLRVTDSALNTADGQFTVIIQPGQPIAITTTLLPVAIDGVAYSQVLTTVGGTGVGYSWSVALGALPPGIVLNPGTPDAALTGTPTQPGVFDFTIEVLDYLGQTATGTYQIRTLAPLVIATTTLPGVNIGVAYNQTISSVGGSGQGQNWSVTSGVLPPGLGLAGNGPSASIQGTPTQTGAFVFSVGVSDSDGLNDEKVFTLNVAYPALIISTTAIPAGFVTQPYHAQIAATGGTSAGYNWSVIGGALPPGISLSSGTPSATLQGTPTQFGSYLFTLAVTDSLSHVSFTQFSILVSLAPLAILPAALANAATATPYLATVHAIGGQPPYSWALDSGTLPPGLILESGTPNATIRGFTVAVGVHAFTLKVQDSLMAFTAAQLSITVAQTLLSFSTPTALPYAVEGSEYSLPIRGNGGVPRYANLALTAGQLPPGIALYPTNYGSEGNFWSPGQLVGTPTAPGAYGFTLRVEDATSAFVTAAFTLTVRPAAGPLSITTAFIGPFKLGHAFTAPLAAAGGSGTGYAWSLLPQSILPPGLTLNAATSMITGQPSALGTFTFTLQVTDSVAALETRTFAVDVTNALPYLFFGAPVRDDVAFLLPANGNTAGILNVMVRAEASYTIVILPDHYRYDFVARGDQFGIAANYISKLWGVTTQATPANRAVALAWVNGPVLNPGGQNPSYAALKQVCIDYPVTLGALMFVECTGPNTSGSAAQILADFPVWWAQRPNTHLTTITTSTNAAMIQYVSALAALASGTFIQA